jgi:hypothetical protein
VLFGLDFLVDFFCGPSSDMEVLNLLLGDFVEAGSSLVAAGFLRILFSTIYYSN